MYSRLQWLPGKAAVFVYPTYLFFFCAITPLRGQTVHVVRRLCRRRTCGRSSNTINFRRVEQGEGVKPADVAAVLPVIGILRRRLRRPCQSHPVSSLPNRLSSRRNLAHFTNTAKLCRGFTPSYRHWPQVTPTGVKCASSQSQKTVANTCTTRHLQLLLAKATTAATRRSVSLRCSPGESGALRGPRESSAGSRPPLHALYGKARSLATLVLSP